MHFPVFKRAFAKMLAIHPKRWYDKDGEKYTKVEEKDGKECTKMAEYSALNIAKYTINRCNAKNTPVTNLQLQKILYFTWIDYYKKTGRELFTDRFFAWKLGPVIPDVYYKYYSNGAEPLKSVSDLTLIFNLSQDKELNSIIDLYRSMSAYDLVEKSHIAHGAWRTVFKSGEGERSVIPFSLIKKKCR